MARMDSCQPTRILTLLRHRFVLPVGNIEEFSQAFFSNAYPSLTPVVKDGHDQRFVRLEVNMKADVALPSFPSVVICVQIFFDQVVLKYLKRDTSS